MAQSRPYIEIVEQPMSTALRFRYITESRKAGSIMGEFSTRANQSFPAIKVYNYSGPLVAKMFCITEQGHLHPHKLVGSNCLDDHGVCIIRVNESLPDNIIRFTNVGIQCSKKDDIRTFLEAKKKVVPECHEPPNLNMIDLTCVKLMFKVYVGHLEYPLESVSSRIIYDKKHCCDLTIVRLSLKSAPAHGNEELFILCNKVKKDDVQVVFSTNSWEGLGQFSSIDIFKECVVVCRVPAYKTLDISEPVDVKLFLRQLSTRETGNKLTFTYRPVNQDPYSIEAKRRKMTEQMVVGRALNTTIGQVPCSVTSFPDIHCDPNSQASASDHDTFVPTRLRRRQCHPNTGHPRHHQQPPGPPSWRVAAPDIFGQGDRKTPLQFYDRLHRFDPSNPFVFAPNQGPPLPLPVQEEAPDVRAVGGMLDFPFPTLDLPTEVKMESTVDLDFLLRDVEFSANAPEFRGGNHYGHKNIGTIRPVNHDQMLFATTPPTKQPNASTKLPTTFTISAPFVGAGSQLSHTAILTNQVEEDCDYQDIEALAFPELGDQLKFDSLNLDDVMVDSSLLEEFLNLTNS